MITIGADPEVFVKDIETGEIQAAQGVVRGSKKRPFQTPNGFVHRDNVLAEMNVVPSESAISFAYNVSMLMQDLAGMLEAHGKELSITSSHIIDYKYLQHFEAARFGCNTNKNCWDIDTEHKPNALDAGQLRTASGHIHIGCKYTEPLDQIQLARECEVCIGLPSIQFDKDARRRTLYGVAGSFRPKEYGIEYTVPSNFWLQSEDLMRWVFNRAAQAISYVPVGRKFSTTMVQSIQHAINTCNLEEAKDIYADLGMSMENV